LAGDSFTGRPRIFAVVVLYGQRPRDSTTVSTLAQALRANRSADCDVWIYDNSPAAGDSAEALPEGFAYQRAAANQGLYGAYEAARLAAAAKGGEWLLTLDQDTVLPENFFAAIEPGLNAAAGDPRIAAIVPHLAEGERLLSPAYVTIGRPKPLPADFTGLPSREARAFNSAALLRVAALAAIGGFDPRFWLDHLDSWLHHQLFLHGWRIYVLPLRLEHHFSLLNYRERLSTERLRNFLAAESAYVDLYGSRIAGMAYTAQLAVRNVNQMRRGETREVRRATLDAFIRRLATRRRLRIAEWNSAMGGRPDLAASQVER
jgi:GT2 family glycosyltransferase